MQLVGINAQHVRQGVCQRRAAKRQGQRTPGPISPETLANNIVKLNLQDLEVVFNGAIRALAKAKVFGAKVTGFADGTDLETTERYTGCGRVTCKRRIEDRRGREHEIEITVDDWKVRLLIDAATKVYRLQCEREDRGGEPVGWQCWRRQLLEQTREQIIVFVEGYYGIFHLAEYSLLLGVKLKDVPPGIGASQDILAKYRLTMRR